MDKLKACPFCGGRAMIAATLDDMYRPMCEKDGCCCLEGYQTRAEAIAAWNTRTPAPAPVGGDVVEALKDVLASLVAAHSLLSRSPKTAAPSDKMFDQMLKDYEKSIERGRKAYTALQAQPAPAQGDDVVELDWATAFEKAAAKTARLEQWQPIETAPRDGSRFLVWEKHYGIRIGRCKERADHDDWLSYMDAFNGSSKGGPRATHWMPLPTPPAAARPRPRDQGPA